MMKGQRRGGLEFLDPPPGLQLWEQPAVLSGNVRYPSIHRNPTHRLPPTVCPRFRSPKRGGALHTTAGACLRPQP
jgi:hypothetical protein